MGDWLRSLCVVGCGAYVLSVAEPMSRMKSKIRQCSASWGFSLGFSLGFSWGLPELGNKHRLENQNNLMSFEINLENSVILLVLCLWDWIRLNLIFRWYSSIKFLPHSDQFQFQPRLCLSFILTSPHPTPTRTHPFPHPQPPDWKSRIEATN